MNNNDVTKNDWFVASVTSPNKSLGDFSQEGLTPQNTQLLSRDEYAKNDKIKSVFQTQEGKFDKKKFNDFYDMSVQTFNQFANDQYDALVLNDSYFAPENIYTIGPVKRMTKTFAFSKEKYNPEGDIKGILGFTESSKNPLSVREIAQTQKVFNSQTNKFEDYTPNDQGFFKNLFGDTAVLATYDEDGFHLDSNTGRQVRHRKGESKLNENGKYFYETLGTREVHGKEVLSPWDVITVDGSYANKFDFMDSDERRKSLMGTVMKTAVMAAPYIIPQTRGIFGGLAAAKTLFMDILPAFSKAGMGVATNNGMNDSSIYKMMNVLEAKGKTLGGSSSDYANQHMFSMENILGMASDVFSQLAQQQFVAKIPGLISQTAKEAQVLKTLKLRPGTDARELAAKLSVTPKAERGALLRQFAEGDDAINKILNNWDKWGSDYGRSIGQLYMTAMSSTGVVEAAKANGLDNRDAAFLLLGTSVGLHQVIKSSLGELALKGLGMDEVGAYVKKVAQRQIGEFAPVVKQATDGLSKKLAGEVGESISTTATNAAKKASLASWFEKGKTLAKGIGESLNKLDTLPAKMLSEGLEEVSEEIVQDGFQQGYNVFRALGWTSTDKNETQAFTMDNVFDKYALAFIGGSIGGALFSIPGLGADMHSAMPKDMADDLVTAYLHGYGEEYEQYLEQAWKKGLLGSTELSTELENVDFNLGSDKNYKPLTATVNGISQNDVTYNMMKNHIDFVKNSIFQERDLSNRSLLNLYKYRNSELLNFEYTTPIKRDIEKLTQQITNLKAQIVGANGGIKSGTVKEEEDVKLAVQPLENELKGLQEELNMIVSGGRYDFYLKHALFAVQPELFKAFQIKDKEDMSMTQFGKRYSKLTSEEAELVDIEYDNYTRLSKADQLEKAVFEFESYMERFEPKIQEMQEYAMERENALANGARILEQMEKLEALSLNPEFASNQDGLNLAIGANLNQDVDYSGGDYNELLNMIRNSKYSDPVFNKLISQYLRKNIPNVQLGLIKGGIITDEAGVSSYDGLELASNPALFFTRYLSDRAYNTELEINGVTANFSDGLSNILYKLESSLDLQEAIKLNNLYDLSKSRAKIEEISSSLSNRIPVFVENNIDEIAEEYEDNTGEILDETSKEDLQRQIITFLTDRVDEVLQAYIHATNGGGAFYNYDTQSFVFDNPTDPHVVNTYKFANEAVEALEQSNASKPNPLFEVAKELSEISGQNRVHDLLDILSKEYGNVMEKSKADEYVIENPLTEMEMEFLVNTLEKAGAVVKGATNYTNQTLGADEIMGYNSAINAAVSKGAMGDGYQERSTLELKPGYIVQQDLLGLQHRVNILLNLNRYNRNGNIREMRSVANRMITLYSEIFEKEGKGYQALKAVGLDLSKLDAVLASSSNLANVRSIIEAMRDGDSGAVMPSDQDTLTNIREESDRIAQTVYEITNVDNNLNDVIHKILDQLDTLDTSTPPIDFSSSTLHLDSIQTAMYIGKSISVDPKQFYKDFAGDLTQEENELTNSKYAPFYGQELALSFAYWSALSPKRDIDTYKLFTSRLLPDNSLSEDKWKPANAGAEAYHSLQNMISIFGIPGAGKSTAVVNTLVRMASQYGLKTAAFVPYESQTGNLVGLPGLINKEFTIEGFLKDVLGSNLHKEISNTLQNFDLDTAIKDSMNNTTNSIVNYIHTGENTTKEKEWFQANLNHPLIKDLLSKDKTITVNGEIPQLIVIDEATQIHSPYMQLLDILISKHNTKNPNNQISVVLTGDLEQNGATMDVKSSKDKFLANMLGFNFLSTPVLSQSLRSDYNLLNNNINRLRALRNEFVNAYASGVSKEAIMTNIIKAHRDFEYSENGDQLIGYKIQDEVTSADIAKLFKYKNANGEFGSVVIITNKGDEHIDSLRNELEEIYKIPSESLRFVTPEKVQGLEFDYVAIDLEPANTRFSDRNVESVVSTQHQLMYTLLSRSRVGSIANTALLGEFTNIISTDKDVFPQMIKLDEGEIDKYKTFTIDSIKNTYNKLDDFSTNVTGAVKRETVAPVSIPPKKISENVREAVLKVIDDNLSNTFREEDAGGKPVKIMPDETDPIGYAYHVADTLKGSIDSKGNFSVKGEDIQNANPDQKNLHLHQSAVTNEAPILRYLKGIHPDIPSMELLDMAKNIYQTMKNDITNYMTMDSDQPLSEYLSRYGSDPLVFNYLNSTEESGDGTSILDNIDNYKLTLITKEFNSEYDKDTSTSGGNTTGLASGPITYFALVSPEVKSIAGTNHTIYSNVIQLGSLANPTSPQIKNIPGVQAALQSISRAHVKYLSDNGLSANNRSYFFLEGDMKQAVSAISNIVIRKLEGEEKPMSFTELTKAYPQFKFSEPLIGHEDLLNDIQGDIDAQLLEAVGLPLSESNKRVFNLKGKTFTLATTDHTLTTPEEMLAKLGSEIEMARTDPNGFYPGTVRILMLNPEGKTFKDWMAHNMNLVTQYKKAEESNTVSKEDLRMSSNEYAAARMFARMINTLSIRKESVRLQQEGGDHKSFFENVVLSKIDYYNKDKGGNPDYFFNTLESVVGIIGTLTTGKDINEFLKTTFGVDGFNLNSYFQDPEMKRKVGLRADANDKSSYFTAQEYFLALDLLKVLKDNDAAVNIINDANEIIGHGYSKQLLNNFVQSFRVAVNGGKVENQIFTSLFRKDSPEQDHFLNALSYMFTTPPPKTTYKPLFPDGIWPDLYFKKEFSHAESEYVPFYKASGDGSNLIGNFRLANRKLKIDISKFNLEDTEGPTLTKPSSQEVITSERITQIDKLVNDTLLEFESMNNMVYLSKDRNKLKSNIVSIIIKDIQDKGISYLQSDRLSKDITAMIAFDNTAKTKIPNDVLYNLALDFVNNSIISKYDGIDSDMFNYKLRNLVTLTSEYSNATLIKHGEPLELDITFNGVVVGTITANYAFDQLTIDNINTVDLDTIFTSPTNEEDSPVEEEEGDAPISNTQLVEITPNSVFVPITNKDGSILSKEAKISNATITKYGLDGYTFSNPIGGDFNEDSTGILIDRSKFNTLTQDVLVNGEKRGIFVINLETGKSRFAAVLATPVLKTDKKSQFMERIKNLFKTGTLETDPNFANVNRLVQLIQNYDPANVDNQINLSRAYLYAHLDMSKSTDADALNNFEEAYKEFVRSKCI